MSFCAFLCRFVPFCAIVCRFVPFVQFSPAFVCRFCLLFDITRVPPWSLSFVQRLVPFGSLDSVRQKIFLSLTKNYIGY